MWAASKPFRCCGRHEVDEVAEAQDTALAGLERLAVRAVDRAEADVFEDRLVGTKISLPSGAEHLLEVEALPNIHHVEDRISVHVVTRISTVARSVVE